MKTKRLSSFWAIFIATMILTFGFFSCTQDEEDLSISKPQPVNKDSIILEVTVHTEEGVEFSKLIVDFANKEMEGGGDYMYTETNDRFFRFSYYGDVTKELDGSVCSFHPVFEGSVDGMKKYFDLVEDVSITLHKGVNKVTLDVIQVPFRSIDT